MVLRIANVKYVPVTGYAKGILLVLVNLATARSLSVFGALARCHPLGVLPPTSGTFQRYCRLQGTVQRTWSLHVGMWLDGRGTGFRPVSLRAP